MRIRTSRIPHLTPLILALLPLVLPLVATAQNENRAESPVTFAVVGDTGTGDEAQRAVALQMVRQREKSSFEFVIMLGDNIYERGEEKFIKSRFEEPYKTLLAAGVKFYATLGNHDIVRGLPFQTNYPNFNMGGRRYYSFAKGAPHDDDYENLLEFFALDTTRLTPEQLKWLDESLKASRARWKIAFSHHPIYSSARMHSPYVALRAKLEPLYVRYGVNAVFSGHSHCYERIKPQNGVHYFTEGASGKLKRGTLDRRSSLFAAGEDRLNSFLIVQTTEHELKVEAIGADGSLVDSYTIIAPVTQGQERARSSINREGQIHQSTAAVQMENHGIAGIQLLQRHPELCESWDGRAVDRVHDVAGRQPAVARIDRPNHGGCHDHAGSHSSRWQQRRDGRVQSHTQDSQSRHQVLARIH